MKRSRGLGELACLPVGSSEGQVSALVWLKGVRTFERDHSLLRLVVMECLDTHTMQFAGAEFEHSRPEGAEAWVRRQPPATDIEQRLEQCLAKRVPLLVGHSGPLKLGEIYLAPCIYASGDVVPP